MKTIPQLLANFALLLAVVHCQAADPGVFRSGDEVHVQFKNLDVLRQTHKQLSASIRLAGEGGQKRFVLDLADPLVPETIAIDVAGYGRCDGVLVEVTSGDGNVVYSERVVPVPIVTMKSDLPLKAGEFAAIEPGTAMRQAGADAAALASAPRIPLPDVDKLRQEKLTVPSRSVTTQEITYPVVTSADLPVPASENYVLVSRQSFAPADATRCSLYFSYRKAIYDAGSTRLKGWRKLLVEVPLDRAWLDRQDDEVLTLPLAGFAVHASDERTPRGTNMLGESPGGLAQGGQSADTDDEGRIYFTNLNDGAGLARFNPHTGKFEQPPVDFRAELRQFIPVEPGWTRNWDGDLGEVVCTRGRVFIVFSRNYRVNTPNGKFETCSGVVSVPQEGWGDAEAFRADIRLHAGCWAGAKHRLYDGEVPVGEYSRKINAPVATTHGLTFASASDAKGGPWRLDLDDEGNTKLLAVVKDPRDAAAADGTPLELTEIVTVGGLRKQRMINVGGAGRQFLRFSYGELQIPRAALGLTLPGALPEHLADARGTYRTTYPGAPAGTLTIRFDITAKIKADAERFGELATALSGTSPGPNYCVIPIPDEPDQAIGVCEYGYYFSKLDFSRRAGERRVLKEYLPMLSSGEKTNLPARVGLGPYNAAWARHDDALWLYLTGYTGMTRLKYAEHGRPLEAFAADMFHQRLAPQAVDGRSRDSVKDFLHIVPSTDGRLIDIGRGRPGRGGGAFSAGLELFDPKTLGKSQTAVYMNRCYGLYTPVSRLVLSAMDAPPRQEIYLASGAIRQEYVEDITDPAQLPANRDPKVFAYDCPSGGNLRDLYGFALPPLSTGAGNSCNMAFSPCRQFLVLLQAGGNLFSYSASQRRFVDGMQLQNAAGELVHPLSFDRPTGHLWSAPSGQLFFLAAGEGPQPKSVNFFEVAVSPEGRLGIRPHLSIAWEGAGQVKDFDGIVRCFLPDLARRDGSYDFVLGGNQESGQPTVRVIDDFIPPRAAARP